MSFRTFLIMQKRAWINLFRRRPRVVDDVLHPPTNPSHPSQRCKCCDAPRPMLLAHVDHLPDCEWLRLRCTACKGDGACGRCGGDGVDPKPMLIAISSERCGEHPTAIKLSCCHPYCSSVATWGFFVASCSDAISYACDEHLGWALPGESSSHHNSPVRINVWSLDRGYDPTHNSAEEIEAAVRSETGEVR